MTTFAQDADGRRLAARSLLVRPILTAARDPEEFALVRRHATALKSIFAAQLGYTLVVESGYARLVKARLDENAPLRPARRASDDAAFGATTYVHLALTCAALLAPGVGEQILISTLVDQIRADAAEHSIVITDSIADRRQLITALGLLISWGVLAETDGSVTAWGERREDEALLTIHRPLLAHLLPSPLYQFASAAQSWSAPADDQPRRRLRRRLVENPAVFRAHLADDERDVLSRERGELTRQLADNFGLTLEVRAEGALAYDVDGGLTDIEFPGNGSLKQAALLLLDELIAALPSEPGGTTGSVLAPWPLVDGILADLTERYRKVWKGSYVDSLSQLRDDVVDLLTSLSLAAAADEGLEVSPFAARYRPTIQTVDAVQVVQRSLFEGDLR